MVVVNHDEVVVDVELVKKCMLAVNHAVVVLDVALIQIRCMVALNHDGANYPLDPEDTVNGNV